MMRVKYLFQSTVPARIWIGNPKGIEIKVILLLIELACVIPSCLFQPFTWSSPYHLTLPPHVWLPPPLLRSESSLDPQARVRAGSRQQSREPALAELVTRSEPNYPAYIVQLYEVTQRLGNSLTIAIQQNIQHTRFHTEDNNLDHNHGKH